MFRRVLPCVIDVGTNNEKLKADPRDQVFKLTYSQQLHYYINKIILVSITIPN